MIGSLVRPRRWWAAGLLSLLLPGLGHVYAGRPRRGLRLFVVVAFMAAAAFVTMTSLRRGVLFVLPALITQVLIAIDAARTGAKAALDYELRPYNRWYVYAGLVVTSQLALEAVQAALRTRAEAFRIPSGAMEPTILIGDFIFVAKDPRHREGVAHGFIVVHRSVEDPKVRAIKRVVGLPGDTLQMIANVLYRNGVRLNEPYVLLTPDGDDRVAPEMGAWQLRYLVGDRGREYRPSARNWGPIRVPADSIFVLGDNRDNSYDSRYWGFLGRDRIEGQPTHVYYSYDRDAPLPLPFLTGIRWDRMALRF